MGVGKTVWGLTRGNSDIPDLGVGETMVQSLPSRIGEKLAEATVQFSPIFAARCLHDKGQ